MAENEDGQEKTEEATPKRLEEARKKGQIPRSRELNTTAMLLMAAFAMILMGKHMIEQLGEIMRLGLVVERAKMFDHWAMIDVLAIAVRDAMLLTMPFFLVMLVTAFAAPIALGGWSFSTEAMAVKFDKLNPITGLKRIFAWRGLMELVKAIIKFLLVGSIGAALVFYYLPEIMVRFGVASERPSLLSLPTKTA